MADLQRALEIAVKAHKGQLQKNGLPFMLHPLTLLQNVDSVEAKIAAVLHDVVEDTAWELVDLEREGFSAAVLAALELLTHREGVSYEDYTEKIYTNGLATEVKLADLTQYGQSQTARAERQGLGALQTVSPCLTNVEP